MRIRAAVLGLAVVTGCGDGTGPTSTGPVIEAVAPAVVASGSGPVTVIVTGRGFTPGSKLHIDEVERVTTVTGSRELRTQLTAAELSLSRTMSVRVVNPEPNAGTSEAFTVAVTNPPPRITGMDPVEVTVGTHVRTLTVNGGNFRRNSVVRWNGSDRTTGYVYEGRLEVRLTAEDVATAGRYRLSVHNPGPEGGTAEIEYAVNVEAARIDVVLPSAVSAGAGATTITVVGEKFAPGAVVRWNRSPRPTTYVSANRLHAEIAAADLSSPRTAEISVANPDPSAIVDTATFWVHPAGTHMIDLHAGDLAWDHVRGRLYASVAPTDYRYANEIVALDPHTGQVVARVSPGLGPGRLAIADDASSLYVTLDDEAAVARIDLATFTRDLRFTIGTGDFGTLWARDIEVLPGSPGTVAVSRVNRYSTVPQEGVALYDHGVMRPAVTRDRVGGTPIEFASPTTLFGFNNETTGFQLFRTTVTDSGLVSRDAKQGFVSEFYHDIRYGAGYVFFTSGSVADATTGWLAAVLPIEGFVCPEPMGGRVYYMTHAKTVHAFSTATWMPVGAQSLPRGAPPPSGSLTRWGEDGFAYVGFGRVAIFRSELISY